MGHKTPTFNRYMHKTNRIAYPIVSFPNIYIYVMSLHKVYVKIDSKVKFLIVEVRVNFLHVNLPKWPKYHMIVRWHNLRLSSGICSHLVIRVYYASHLHFHWEILYLNKGCFLHYLTPNPWSLYVSQDDCFVYRNKHTSSKVAFKIYINDFTIQELIGIDLKIKNFHYSTIWIDFPHSFP